MGRSHSPQLSIIIPTYNEAPNLATLLPYLRRHTPSRSSEIIVVDGQSDDNTVAVAEQHQVTVVDGCKRCRSIQLNQGAAISTGRVLYFLHADTRPPKTFFSDILTSIEAGFAVGCYRFRFDSPSWLLRINAFCTRFNHLACRGGDQSLFITRTAFQALEGFRSDYIVMEDYDLVERAQQRFSFRIIPKEITVSARKYQRNGYFRVQYANFVVFRMYRRGADQREILDKYRSMLN